LLSNAGHCGRPGPLGSPFAAKLPQYDMIVSDMARFSGEADGRNRPPKFPKT